MSATAAFANHFAQVPVELITVLNKGTALRIVSHLLSLCNLKKPEFWVDQGLLGQKLGIHRDTVGRWIRYMEKNGFLEFLGFTGYGGRKRYRLTFSTKQSVEPNLATSCKTAGPIQTFVQEDVRQKDRNINIREETNLKEQTEVSFDDFNKKELSSNEKIALKQKLKIIGVHKHAIQCIVSKYPIEKINTQIQHLQLVINRGDLIESKASWLVAAIKGNYELPPELDKGAIEKEQKAKELQKAAQLAQIAQREFNVGNVECAIKLAEQSLAITENRIAREILDKEQQRRERQRKIENARKSVSAEKLAVIQQEEKQKKLLEMRKISRLSEAQILSSKFFKMAVEELINERLCA
jgi:hypothetical protein